MVTSFAEVDDRETRVDQADVVEYCDPGVIGSPVTEGIPHTGEPCFRDALTPSEDTTPYPAHDPSISGAIPLFVLSRPEFRYQRLTWR